MTENGQKYHPLHDDQQTTTDQQAPVDGPMGVWATLGALANRIRAITGRSTFRDNPPTNLTEAKAHHDATGNVHNLTRAQLGAAAATDLDSHKADQQNPHNVTAAQAGAPPTSRTVSTTAPLSGGGNLSANRTLSISPASQSAAGSMSASDKSKLDGLDAANYAPASHVGSGGVAHANAVAGGASGFMTGVEKSKLESLVPPQRVYVAPEWADQSIAVTSNGWQTTMFAPEISVPPLGAPPAGFKWLIDIEGGIRIAPPNSNVSLFLAIGFDRTAASGVDGGGTLFAAAQGALPVFRYGTPPPATNRSFTVNFYFWTIVQGTYSVRPGPYPVCRAYLVAA